MMRNGEAALVTGGSAGIGLAVAGALADAGWTVYVTGRSPETLGQAVAADPRLIPVRSDMADPAAIRDLAARIEADGRRLGVLVANAGNAEATVLGETTEAGFDTLFDLNVRGVFFLVQTLASLMNGGGSIVLIGSFVSIKGGAGLSVYNASKAAVRSFARSWASDLSARRIRVNVVSPGPVRTPLAHRLQGEADGSISGFETWAAQASPGGRIGEPEDIADVVAFLASDAARHINGVELFVDGGLSQV
jgi:NAD(P)-dependent dehydrogenase (short-subunit alcohol dehydrogenase family)